VRLLFIAVFQPEPLPDNHWMVNTTSRAEYLRRASPRVPPQFVDDSMPIETPDTEVQLRSLP
jgi:hypothetical protein